MLLNILSSDIVLTLENLFFYQVNIPRIAQCIDMHISRVFDFSRDARKIDPFLARIARNARKDIYQFFPLEPPI